MADPDPRGDERIELRISADQKTLSLTSRDWRRFLSALDKTEHPRPNLEAAARRYRRRRT